MEATYSSEKSIDFQLTTLLYIAEDTTLLIIIAVLTGPNTMSVTF
jgi:hypothetical protein